MSARRPSLGNLGGNAAQGMVAQEKLAAAMKNVMKILKNRPDKGMELLASAPEPAPQLHTRESFMALARANPKGGRRRKSQRQSRKNHKSRKMRRSRRKLTT